MTSNLRMAGLSDLGPRYTLRGEAYLLDESRNLAVVIDGLPHLDGLGGQVADFVVDVLQEDCCSVSAQAGSSLMEWMQLVHQRLLELHTRFPWHVQSAAHLAACLIVDDEVAIAHIGDVRAYRLRDGRLERLTRDHTWVAHQVALGKLTEEEGRLHPMPHITLRALGYEPAHEVELRTEPLRPDDLFLLCTSGLWDAVPDEDLLRIVSRHRDDPAAACGALIAFARRPELVENPSSRVVPATVAILVVGSDDPALPTGG